MIVAEEGLSITQGQEHIERYSLPESPGIKHFCKKCGTPLYNTNPKYGPIKIVYLGSINEHHHLIPNKNIFCNYKLNWLHDIFDRENKNEGVK